MAYTNLLAKIESEINDTNAKLRLSETRESVLDLIEKKKKLEELAFAYVNLEGRYKELAGLNSVY